MTRPVGAVALVVGAVLAVVGTFLPVYSQTYSVVDPMTLTQTAWSVTGDSGMVYGRGPWFGLPVVVGAVLMVLGAVFSTRMWGRLAAIGGAMLSTGAVWALAQYVGGQILSVEHVSPIAVDLELGSAVLPAAALVGLVGALLVQEWPRRGPTPDADGVVVHRLDDPGDPDADDTDTPPFGFPAVPGDRAP